MIASMAEKITELPPVTKGRISYPWAEWFDGSAWKLTRGTDFHISPAGFQKQVTVAARVRGLRAVTRSSGDDVFVQAIR